jgi:hypothetical protein
MLPEQHLMPQEQYRAFQLGAAGFRAQVIIETWWYLAASEIGISEQNRDPRAKNLREIVYNALVSFRA